MPPRYGFLSNQTKELSDSMAFDDKTSRDLWSLAFEQNANATIDNLGSHLNTQSQQQQHPIPMGDDGIMPRQQAPIINTPMPELSKISTGPSPAHVAEDAANAPPQPSTIQQPTQLSPASSSTSTSSTTTITPGAAPSSTTTAPPATGKIDNSSRESFITTAYPYALQAADGDPVLARQLLATAISENGTVGTGRDLGEMGFNVGGIQGVEGPAGSFTASDAGRPRKFAAYNNLSEGFRAVRDLVSGGRYAAAAETYKQTGDIDRYWREVNQAGYSETPDWQDRISNIRRNQVEPLTQDAPRQTQSAPPQQQQGDQAGQPGDSTVSLKGITPPQFGLGDADAESICGPVLLMAFSKSTGRNPTIQEAKDLAAQNGGWTSAQGMGGPEATANTLRKMGIPATYKPGALDVETIRKETQNGNPVGINTRGHYFVVEGVDAEGRLDLGNSAKSLKASGGRQWFKPEEIAGLGMGAPTGAIYKDSPNSPTPSVAVKATGMPPAAPTAGASPPAAPSSPPAGATPPAPAGAPDTLRAQLDVGQGDTMSRVSLNDPVPMPEDASQSEQYVQGLSAPTDRGPAPLQNTIPFDPATNTYGPASTAPAEPLSYRQPLDGGAVPMRDRWATDPTQPTPPYDPRDADQGPHELAPAPVSTYNDPTTTVTQSQPIVASPTTYGASGDELYPMPAWAQPPTDPTISDPNYTQPAGLRYDPNDPSTGVNPLAPGSLRPTDIPPEMQGARPWLPATTPAGGIVPPPGLLDTVVPRAAQTGPQFEGPAAPTRWSPAFQAQYGQGGEAAPFQDDQREPGYRPTPAPRTLSPYQPGSGNALVGVPTAPSDQEILAGQGPIARGIDAFDRGQRERDPDYAAGSSMLTPESLISPENRQTFMQPAPGSTPSSLVAWHDRMTAGAADALAAGLGQDPDRAVVAVTIGGMPVRMTVSDLLENVTDPAFGAGFSVGDIVLDAVGERALRIVAPYVKGAAKAVVNRLVGEAKSLPEIAARGARALGEGLAPDAGRVASEAPGVQMLGSGVVPEDSRRMYHGTAEAFPRPDPGKFDPNGLYGPGYYLTDNPTVASSYANSRNFTPGGITPKPVLRSGRLQQEIDSADRFLANPRLSADDRAFYEGQRARASAELERVTSQGPNVRAVDVPRGLRLIDIEAPLRAQPGLVDDVTNAISDPTLAARFDNAMRSQATVSRRGPMTGDDLWQALEATYGDGRLPTREQFAQLHADLQDAGIDGLTHQGGKNMPLLDDAGKPIEHGVTVIFPHGLDRITNAFSGEAGGAGFIPSGSTLRNAAQGAFVGAASEDIQAQQEGRDPDPTSRLVRGAIGAGIGVVAGSRAARGAASHLGSGFVGRPANEAASAAPNPVMQQMARQMAGNHAPSGVTNSRGIRERWAQAWTDDRAGIRNFQEAVSKALGRPLTAGESVAELTRVNPASVASQRLDDGLKPALQAVGEDEDYLAQYLVHKHNVDVAREIGQRAYDDAITVGKSPAQAAVAASRASATRQFSGDLHLTETTQALQDIEQRVKSLPDGAARWQDIENGAQAVWDTNRQTLERKRDAGIISDDLYNELTQRYPHYVRTDIADYFDKGAGGPAPAGKRLGLSDIGIQKISSEGTAKERVNPILSTIDQTYASESSIARNEAGKAFEELVRLDPSWQSTFKEVVPSQGVNRGNPATTVPSSYSLRNGEQFLKVWDGGQARTYVIPKEYAALVSPQTGRVLGDSGAAKLLSTAMNVYKSLITSKNPAFSLVVSPIRDLGDYAIREGAMSAKSKGPLGVAQGVAGAVGALGDYARAVPDAFAGILQGTYKGDLARMMREGAGQISRPGHDQQELRGALRDLQRTNGLEVRSTGDLARLVGNVLTLGAEPVGNRIEQIPRLAASRRAQRRGASDLGQAMAFRDATVDFQRAGEWSRAANSIIPFFNVAMQSGAQTARTFKANPAAFMGAVAASVGTMTLAAEAWNHADEQRAADYEDVPDYLKKTGVVFMLPGVEGRAERGDRLPNYVWVPVGQYGSLVQTAKQTAADYVAGKSTADLSSPSGWGQLGAEVAGIFSPIRGDSAGSVLSSVTPPGLSTGLELAANKDLFRGSTIATDRKDEQASALSQGTASVYNAATGQETRPSQWEYAYRDLGGYGSTLALEGSNLLTERLGMRQPKNEDRPIQNTPIAGGLVNRVVRDAGGQRLEDARTEMFSPAVRDALSTAGMRRDEVPPAASTIQDVPLTREEQTDFQVLFNEYMESELARASGRGDWSKDKAGEAITRARQRASSAVLRTIPAGERRDRKETAGAR